jgi:hypothetical protein
MLQAELDGLNNIGLVSSYKSIDSHFYGAVDIYAMYVSLNILCNQIARVEQFVAAMYDVHTSCIYDLEYCIYFLKSHYF